MIKPRRHPPQSAEDRAAEVLRVAMIGAVADLGARLVADVEAWIAQRRPPPAEGSERE